MASDEEVQPYLFRFKRECRSPRRFTGNPDYHYDPELQMAVTSEDGKKILAIDSPRLREMYTKKADIEKGEDQKENYVWR